MKDRKTPPKSDLRMNRRGFFAGTAATGAAVTAAGILGTSPGRVFAQTASAPVITPITEMTTPISKAKEPFPLEFVRAARARFSFPNWQSGGDDSVYYNLNVPEFFNCGLTPPVMKPRPLKRAIVPDLENLTFTTRDGSETPPLKEYLVGPKRLQAMIMAHNGKVVFESYPGMNQTDMHVWMSASKTVVGLLAILLEVEGKIDFERPITDYAPQLQGTAWDAVSFRNAMNMASGLDVEESFANLSNPESWIGRFFTAMMTGTGSDWIDVMREARPLPGEAPGTHMRYSTAITQALSLAIENVAGITYAATFGQHIWSKIGVVDPFFIVLLSEGTALGGGGNFTAIEDFLRYSMIYTPSWHVVSDEQIVTEPLLNRIQTLGDPAAFDGSTEQDYGHSWFGELPERNSAQWDDVFGDGAMFKHGNMGQGIYVDPARNFCGVHFALGPNDGPVDWSPGYQRAAAKMLAGG